MELPGEDRGGDPSPRPGMRERERLNLPSMHISPSVIHCHYQVPVQVCLSGQYFQSYSKSLFIIQQLDPAWARLPAGQAWAKPKFGGPGCKLPASPRPVL